MRLLKQLHRRNTWFSSALAIMSTTEAFIESSVLWDSWLVGLPLDDAPHAVVKGFKSVERWGDIMRRPYEYENSRLTTPPSRKPCRRQESPTGTCVATPSIPMYSSSMWAVVLIVSLSEKWDGITYLPMLMTPRCHNRQELGVLHPGYQGVALLPFFLVTCRHLRSSLYPNRCGWQFVSRARCPFSYMSHWKPPC